jgi:hypothetical protein
LNWGSSYLVHDFYRRFVKKNASERHYVNTGRMCTVVLYIFAALLSLVMSSAQEAFEILISIGAGTGLIYLVRWFWWRVNAWSEVVAMASSFAISVALFVLKKQGHPMPFAHSVIYSVAFTTVCWLLATFLAPRTTDEKLVDFYQKVRPPGPGWERVRLLAGVSKQEAAQTSENLPLATLGWISGCIAIWSSLFAVGNFLYGRNTYGIVMLVTFIVSGSILVYVVNRVWNQPTLEEEKAAAPAMA